MVKTMIQMCTIKGTKLLRNENETRSPLHCCHEWSPTPPFHIPNSLRLWEKSSPPTSMFFFIDLDPLRHSNVAFSTRNEIFTLMYLMISSYFSPLFLVLIFSARLYDQDYMVLWQTVGSKLLIFSGFFLQNYGQNFAKNQKIKNLNLPFVEELIILIWTDLWP